MVDVDAAIAEVFKTLIDVVYAQAHRVRGQ
jgi:hypothetical protein